MSELTRDEIRRACEAVGWSHYNREGDQDMWWPEGDGGAIYTSDPLSDADALALLEATGHAFKVHHVPGRAAAWWLSWDVPWPSPTTWHAGATLPEAAVRAVLAWAKAKEAKG